ncbi:MAG: phosphate ABC transporter ATP-binding protein PstB [Candidatus Margulisiibacteriota bacterium]|jgi:phosphate transport system ATP-binding protein
MKNIILDIKNLNLSIAENQILKNVNLKVAKKSVTAIMGPSGCGKTTLLRCINRMNDFVPQLKVEGHILLYNKDLMTLNPIFVRRLVGMVFQRPNPFPTMTIFQNVLSGYILNGIKLPKSEQNQLMEEALTNAALWDEVKDVLHRKGTSLSGGQQQRLCIARSLALKPRVLLLDEPTSALDPKATAKIEELIVELKKTVTIILVTHNISQASRVSNYTAFLYLGEMIEFGTTEKLFTVPEHKKTEEYLTGRFG